MTVAVKCNITKYTLQQIGAFQWGTKPLSTTISAIYENYIEFLQCPTSTYDPCYDACQSTPILNTCQITIGNLLVTTTDQITFTFSPSSIGSQAYPITYQWYYDSYVFDLSSTTTTSTTLTLKLKPNKIVSLISTLISLVVTDVDKCQKRIDCVFSGGVLQCGVSAVCSNTSDLHIEEEKTCYGVTLKSIS